MDFFAALVQVARNSASKVIERESARERSAHDAARMTQRRLTDLSPLRWWSHLTPALVDALLLGRNAL